MTCTECICYEDQNCAAPSELIENGFCNDEANTPGCSYDGGDCCLECINTDLCSECLCKEGGEPAIDVSCCEIPSWIGDGYCDDVTNNADCHFDGGDCCGVNVNTSYCTECICYE